MSVKPLPAPLAVNPRCIVIAVEATEPAACLSMELLIKDTLPGLPIAITDFPPGGGLGCGQQERDTKAAAEPERRHGRAALRRCGCLPGVKYETSVISGKFLPREDSYALLYPCGKARVYLGAAFLAPGSGCTQA